jgi:hypothetical protein
MKRPLNKVGKTPKAKQNRSMEAQEHFMREKNLGIQYIIILQVNIIRIATEHGKIYQHLEVHPCVLQRSSFFHDQELQSL